ncbi:LysR family transcriptional regulator [Streptomonospora wellingtoniae]|uniref:LysR family transcriptional regulator n=1 Tax=Streptomonospora wellingtoniae TaxID=3075544 RepID=A0ABU2KY25_9ACTN|nr:LysR family transcriptional regulator [Streptomonospora sp. DSM 45055]MDT0304195.1 LysR family transcriptional regulator [Streptomonospora sp. DSM 45055]
MQEFDLRELRYFLAAAEELNLSRAAERLGISQPPLSRAIRQMERRLGAPLFHRRHNTIRLTPAGDTLFSEARKVLDAAAAASRRTRRAGRTTPALTVTAAPGRSTGLLRSIVASYARLPDAARTDIAVTGYRAQEATLRRGEADLALLGTPFGTEGLCVRPLCSEERVAAVPADHRLAGRAALQCADLAGEPFPRWPGDTEASRRYWSGQDRAAAVGADGAQGPLVHDISQVIEVVGLGQALALVPRHVAAANPRPDVVYVPVADASAYRTVLAWPEGATGPAVELFVRTAADLFATDPPPDTGPLPESV